MDSFRKFQILRWLLLLNLVLILGLVWNNLEKIENFITQLDQKWEEANQNIESPIFERWVLNVQNFIHERKKLIKEEFDKEIEEMKKDAIKLGLNKALNLTQKAKELLTNLINQIFDFISQKIKDVKKEP